MESPNFDLLIPITAASDNLVTFPGSMVFGNKVEVDKNKKTKGQSGRTTFIHTHKYL